MANIKIKSIAELTAGCASFLPTAVDLQGWNSDHPIFDRLVEETNPKTIIENGTWKGRSAKHFAVATAGRVEMDEVSGTNVPAPSRIYCVDTWLGGIDHVMSDKPQDDRALDMHGSPRLYHQFLRNFVDEPEFAKRVFPVQQPSVSGARLLAHLGVKAELIYIDASHEYQDVYADLCAFVQLLTDGGVMFGDDFRFPGVFAAVLRFAHEYNLKIEEVENNFWILRQNA